MLNQLFKLLKTWVGAVFIALLVASFALWGVSDIFISGPRDAVVLVGKDRISVARVSTAFERELSRYSEQSEGQIDREMALALGLQNQVISDLAGRSAMTQRTEALGLTASDDAVADELSAIDAFRDPITGRFDRDTYLSLLSQNSLTPQQFESDIASDRVQTQLASVLSSGLRPPDVLAETRVRFAREIRSMSIVIVPSEAAGEIAAPSQDDVEAFFRENEAAYATPPRRAVSVVTLALEDFIPDVPVSEEELQEAYELRRDLMSTPERRTLVELAAPDEATAADVARRLRAGEEPDAIAEALNLAPPTVYEDALQSDILTSQSGEAAFAVAEGDVAEPVDGRISWFVSRVDVVTPGHEPSFFEARTELEFELASDGAGEMLFDAIDGFEIARGQGANMEAAARAARTPVFSYAPVDQSGLDAGGVRPTHFADHPEMIRAAFEQPAVGQMSELIELGEEGYFVVRVDRMIDAGVRPLAEVEDDVRERLVAQRRAAALDALAASAREALEAGESVGTAASAAGELARSETSELTRTATTQTLTPSIVASAFRSEPGAVVTGPTADGGRAVVRVDSVAAAGDASEGEIEALRARLSLEIADDLSQMFNSALQAAYPVRVDEALLAQATGADTAQQ